MTVNINTRELGFSVILPLLLQAHRLCSELETLGVLKSERPHHRALSAPKADAATLKQLFKALPNLIHFGQWRPWICV